MLQDDERHPAVGWEMFEEAFEGFETAGRSADADDVGRFAGRLVEWLHRDSPSANVLPDRSFSESFSH